MKWCCLSLPALALLLSACATGYNEIVPFGDGLLRAPSGIEAQDYCRARGATVRMRGKAPGETGVFFDCN